MCGLAGILRLDDDAPPIDPDDLARCRDAMRARGPDGEGLWIAPSGRVGLAHRRLAILDLSDAGLQPMADASGRYRVVLNGEIYNFRELRAELGAAGVRFRSQSDTEVLVELWARHGTDTMARLRGMYAFAMWDDRDRELVLARDPYGIKPLYYSVAGGRMRFASQVRALELARDVPDDVEPAGLVGFLLWGSVPEPWTLRRAVRAVPAGHYVVARAGRVGPPVAHYDFGRLPEPGAADPAVALEDSVRAHLVSDVPVAVFLSAGLDSSLIAALARRAVDEPPVTLTLRFDAYRGTPLDEAPLAAEIARAIGTRHVERSVGRDDFLDLWPNAIAAMDQPSIDGFNTFVVSRVAHEQGIKVVLSGLGGDEIAGSYPSFRDVPRWSAWARRLGRVPGLGLLWPAIARSLRPDQRKLAGILDHARTPQGAYFLRRGLFLPEEIPAVVGAAIARQGLAAYDPAADAGKHLGHDGRRSDGWVAVHVMESSQYMRNQLLRDSDWASMAHSLELRVPLVDVRLREALARARFEPARSQGKAELVRRAAPELPDAVWTRPKSGFSIPVSEWIDPEVRPQTPRGLASRSLALRVLGEFGVPLDPARSER